MVKGPKEKKERSLGERLQLKAYRCQGPKCAMVRKPHKPGTQGKSRRHKNLSDFGRQMKEKQKFKVSYGLNERNLRKVFERATKQEGSTGSRMLQLLELRLDNVLFRAGFAGSRAMGRQILRDGHIFVNGKRVYAPGFLVKTGDTVSIRPESLPKTLFKNLKESLKQFEAPSWIHIDAEKTEAKVLSLPQDLNIPFEVNALVESFSK